MKADNEMSVKDYFLLPKTPRPDLKRRIAVLDQVFSKYIRLRDADSRGYCRCITCGRSEPWKEMDAGHFVSRDRKAVRWDERNVHAQCPHCNRFRAGMQFLHGRQIDCLHGRGTADMLMQISRARIKVSLFEVEHHIVAFREKTKKLLENH
jgi:hypothetical protein